MALIRILSFVRYTCRERQQQSVATKREDAWRVGAGAALIVQDGHDNVIVVLESHAGYGSSGFGMKEAMRETRGDPGFGGLDK